MRFDVTSGATKRRHPRIPQKVLKTRPRNRQEAEKALDFFRAMTGTVISSPSPSDLTESSNELQKDSSNGS